MSSPADALTRLNTLLTNHANLTYVKQFMFGVREKITLYPVLIIEPVSVGKEDNLMSAVADLKLEVDIYGLLTVEGYDKDKQIVGDATYKGILDFENDVKIAIDSDQNLAGNVIDMIIGNIEYAVEYPVRQFKLRLTIFLRQVIGTR